MAAPAAEAGQRLLKTVQTKCKTIMFLLPGAMTLVATAGVAGHKTYIDLVWAYLDAVFGHALVHHSRCEQKQILARRG